MDKYNSIYGEISPFTQPVNSISQWTSPGTLNYIPPATVFNAKLSAALVKAQSEMGNATKESKNPFFKSSYANLNSVREAVLPALNKNGIAVLQPINGNVVTTILLHESGEQMSSNTNIVCAKQNDPQAYGSAVSYARRYGLQSMVCIGAEDDDAEKAVVRETKLAPQKDISPLTVEQKIALTQAVNRAVTEATPALPNPNNDLPGGPLAMETDGPSPMPAKRGWAGKKSTPAKTETSTAKGDLF